MLKPKFLIIGLGNPGTQYEYTRHNIGSMVCQEFIKKYNGEQITPNQYIIKGENADYYVGFNLNYMNISGEQVYHMMIKYNITPEQLIVIHDDLDLNFSVVDLKYKYGAGGHNGLRSISSYLPSQTKYKRIRIGIGRSTTQPISDFVVSKFSDDEMLEMNKIYNNTLMVLLTKITQNN